MGVEESREKKHHEMDALPSFSARLSLATTLFLKKKKKKKKKIRVTSVSPERTNIVYLLTKRSDTPVFAVFTPSFLVKFLENCSQRRVPVVCLKITTSSGPARVGSGPSLGRNDAWLASVPANHGSNPDSSTVQLSEWNHPASFDWIQTHERFKIRLFSRTKHNMRIWILFGSCLISSSHSCFTFLFDWAAKPGPVDLPETFPQSSFPIVLDLLFNETTFNEEVTKFVNTQTSVLNGTDKILISR